MNKTEQLRKLMAGSVPCRECDDKGFRDIWPPYGGIDKEKCYSCSSSKRSQLIDFLRNNAPAILAVMEAVEYVSELHCPQNPETALGRSLKSAIEITSKALARWNSANGGGDE